MDTNKLENKEVLDSKWYERLKVCGSFQIPEYLDGDKAYRETQKSKFLNGEIDNPKLDYPKIDMEKLDQFEKDLLTLKEEIKIEEKNETIKQLYVWKINEKIAEIRMLRAAKDGKMRTFKIYSEFVYGTPSKPVFSYTIAELQKKAETQLNSENEELKKTAQELLGLLPNNLPEAEIEGLPDETLIQRVKEETQKELSQILKIEISEIDKQFTSDEIKTLFEAGLANLKADGWKVVIDESSKTAISVDQEKKEIKIPVSRKLALEKIKPLIAHEIGTHVARRENGERSSLMLLGLGLDRYEAGEEGVATLREQTFKKEIDEFAGFEGHFAIGLAYGLDGKKRNFREVYEILEKHFYLKALLKKDPKDENYEKTKTVAQNNAWNRAVRTFRGSDMTMPGVCLTKDIIYRQGNIAVWQLLGKKPEELLRFSVGKYDPANPRHIWILDQLGITEKDLDYLNDENQEENK